MSTHESDTPWGAVAFVFVLLGLLFIFVFTVSRDTTAPVTPAGEGPHQQLSDLEQFWLDSEGLTPDYQKFDAECPVDGTTIAVPNSTADNRLGGVTTDLMKIALRRSEDGSNRPDFELQDYEQKLVTCPTCGATYLAVDLSFIISGRLAGSAERLQDWQLANVVAGLDIATEPDWTFDVKSYFRYQTQMLAGYPGNEAAFAALAGAYCSNFAVWYGREYTVPSPAFYALAAARLKTDLDQGLPANPAIQSMNAMLLGELYRLLGRSTDAKHWFDSARSIGGLDPGIISVLEASEERLAAGDFSLGRIPDREGSTPPPFGWQVDLMLPAINGNIDRYRDDWNTMDSIAEIEAGISKLILDKYLQ